MSIATYAVATALTQIGNKMSKLWDLNVWFRDFGLDEDGLNQWADTITINPAIYVINGDAVNHIYTGVLYECSADETAKIRTFRNEMEYGTDWFDFSDELYALDISRGIQDFIESLGDPNTIPVDDVDSLYEIDSIDKLSGLRTLPTNDG